MGSNNDEADCKMYKYFKRYRNVFYWLIYEYM